MYDYNYIKSLNLMNEKISIKGILDKLKKSKKKKDDRFESSIEDQEIKKDFPEIKRHLVNQKSYKTKYNQEVKFEIYESSNKHYGKCIENLYTVIYRNNKNTKEKEILDKYASEENYDKTMKIDSDMCKCLSLYSKSNENSVYKFLNDNYSNVSYVYTLDMKMK